MGSLVLRLSLMRNCSMSSVVIFLMSVLVLVVIL